MMERYFIQGKRCLDNRTAQNKTKERAIKNSVFDGIEQLE